MKKAIKFISIMLIIYFVVLGILNIRVYNIPKFETFEEQLEYADNLFSEKQDPLSLTRYYFDLGFKKPLIAYKKIIEWYPQESKDNIEVYGGLGVCYKKTGNYKIALEYYYKNLEIYKRTKPEGHMEAIESIHDGIANLYIQMGKPFEAIKFYEKSIPEFPPDDFKERRMTRYHFTYQIANIYCDDIKDRVKADEWYKKAAEIRPY